MLNILNYLEVENKNRLGGFMRKRTKIIITIGILCVILFAFFGMRKSSVSNFPIPIIAHKYKVNSNGAVFYKFKGTEDLYLPLVRLYGWREKDQLGSMHIYKKGDKTVNVVNIRNGFVIENH